MSSTLSPEIIQKLTMGKVKSGKAVGSSFGTSNTTLPLVGSTGTNSVNIQNDYFYITVTGMDSSVLLETRIDVTPELFETVGAGSLIINIGKHLRSLGLESGVFNVNYNFLRRQAGFFKEQVIDNTGELYFGPEFISEDQLYKGTPSNTTELNDNIKLGEVGGGLLLTGISPSRTEVYVGRESKILNTIYIEESDTYFNPTYVYFFTATNSTYTGNWGLPYVSKHPWVNSEALEKYRMGGITSGQIAHGSDVMSLTKANKVIERERFDKVYQPGTTRLILKDFFVIAIEEIPVTRPKANADIESRPMESPIGANGPNNSVFTGTLSLKEQWVYDGTEDTWMPNLEVIQTDEDGNYNFNELVDGVPLDITFKKKLIPWPFEDTSAFWDEGSGGATFNTNSFYNTIRQWFFANREILNKFTNIQGDTFNWDEYGIFDATGGSITEDVIFQFMSDFDSIISGGGRPVSTQNLKNDIRRYFYLQDRNNLSNLVSRTELETVFVEQKIYSDFVADIVNVNYDGDYVDSVVLKYSPKQFAEIAGIYLEESPNDTTLYTGKLMFFDVGDSPISKLSTYLNFADGYRALICNSKSGGSEGIFKLVNPLPDDIFIGETVHIVEEILPSTTYGVELIPWLEPPIPTTILLPPDQESAGDVIQPLTTQYKTWAELSFQSSSLYRDIINKVISGSINETELNVDYSEYDNFVHFSSAEKRLRNFKYKLDLLEGYEQESSSIAGLYTGSGALGNDPNTVVTGSQQKLDSLELQIDELKNNLDGYEKYLYFESASFTTSSFGMHYDATWPKQNTSKPYALYNTSQSIASTWFDNQIVSASDYDILNKDYLIYHLPEYIREDSEHRVFLRLVKMLGQHFDNIKNYIDEFGTIHDRQESLTKGLPKQLTSTIAESMGWKVASGWDLVEIDEYTLGKKVAQDNTITSSSAVPYQDISKEIWSRILANMPLFLKAKGTLKALKGLVTCYGIPSTILRVREYGGPIKHEVNPDYEAVRRFSKALDFKQAQYVHTKWSGSADTGMKPKTVEFRFKAVSSSNMNLVQMQRGGESADINHGQAYGGSNYAFTAGWTGGEKDRPSGWGVWLKDNGSADNMASIVFSISGSNQSGSMPAGEYKEVTSSLLPFFNGDFWSVMLRKELVNAEILSTRIHSGSVGMVTGSHNFETGSLQTPFESAGDGGTLEVISQSSYVFDGSYSLGLKNTRTTGEAYTYPYTNNDDGTNQRIAVGSDITYGDARVASASFAEEFDFSVYARSKTGGAQFQMWIMELGEKGNILEESYTYYPDLTKNWGYGALHIATYGIGTKWEKYTVRAKINHPNTNFIGLRLDNETNGQTIYFDKGELRKVGTDSLKFDIIAKQFDGGRDVIQYQTQESLIIDGLSNAASASYTGSWEQDGNLFIGGTTRAQNWYGGFVSGSTLSQTSSSLSGSMMEFRLWSTPLDEKHFDTHVENPQSFVGNNFTGSINELVQRLSFNEDNNHGTGADSEKSIRNTAANNNYPYTGSAKGFADENNYSSVVDRLKLKLPKIGGIRRSANKARVSPRQLKDEFKGSLNLSPTYRVEKSVGSIDTKDSERLGVYFSPVDVINEDIISTLSDLDLEDKLGDPRDDSRSTYDKYGGLKQTADIYWQKYKGSNNFWDYLRLINYYDHSIFSQVKKLIPARAKATVGVLIENNILERNKIARETPFREYPVFEDTLTKLRSSGSDYFELSGENQVWENPVSYANIFRSGSHFAELSSFNDFIERDVNYKGSVMNFGKTYQNWGSQYSGSYTTIGASSIFTESIAMIFEQRTSKINKKPIFIYDTPEDFYKSNASSVSFQSSSYENLADDAIGLERAFFLGTQNTKETALPSKDLSGQITYDAVTSVLTNPYVTVTQTSPNVKLTTELDTGADQLDIKEDD